MAGRVRRLSKLRNYRRSVVRRPNDLDAELEGKNVIIEPFSPFEGVRVAFILTKDGVPIELMQYD